MLKYLYYVNNAKWYKQTLRWSNVLYFTCFWLVQKKDHDFEKKNQLQ